MTSIARADVDTQDGSARDTIITQHTQLQEDETLLLRMLVDCSTLASHGMLQTTRATGHLMMKRYTDELLIVRATKRHLHRQAIVEGIEFCDVCGQADGVTTTPITYGRESSGLRSICISCRRERQ